MRRTALITLLLLATAATVTAAQAAPRAPQLTAEPLLVKPGDVVTLTGRGFPRDVHVALLAGPPHADATRIGGARTGSRGRFTATIHIRPGSSTGVLVAVACHDACRVRASVRFRIAAR